VTDGSDAAPEMLLFDTHALVWSVNDGPKLGIGAKELIRTATREDRILVSAITPWEIALLIAKKRLTLNRDVMDWIGDAVTRPGVTLTPLGPEIAVASTRLPFEMHADPADRILVATARHIGATLVTADRSLLDLSVQGHFQAIDAGR